MSARVESWGRLPRTQQELLPLHFRDDALPEPGARTLLAHGLGRSYGDSALNDGGALLLTRGLDRFIDFDTGTGVLRAEAGVSLAEIIDLVLPRGWFLPVTPGTKFVTLGGAVANDVHGKNHHAAGSFGRHLRAFELLRSDGSRRRCSREENADWFGATIGGLGLTGLITWVEIQLRRVCSPLLEVETLRFGGAEEFFQLAADSESGFEYTVAWIDCLARGTQLGRGLFMRANHAAEAAALAQERVRAPRLSVPFAPPISAVNALSLRLFNAVYYRAIRTGAARQHYEPYFYPLDGIGRWNRLYGPRGFYQYQCVVPERAAVVDLLRQISDAGSGSMLVVLKTLGAADSPGWLSFARPGYTLALDFPEQGEVTARLFERLDAIVTACGGALYPAKDARMPAALFQSAYPRWTTLEAMRDPAFSSSFWRRVTGSH